MTSGSLASAMVRALGDAPQAKWLEPSHGDGAFLSALATMGVPRRRIWAVDLHRRGRPHDAFAQTQRGMDFLQLQWQGPRQFDRIIGNPPYLAIERLAGSLRNAAVAVRTPAGGTVGANANTWYAFVCRSLELLAPGGSMAFVLPAAAEFASYCTEARTSLIDHFESIDSFRLRQTPFEDALDGNVILIARERKPIDQLSRGIYRRKVVDDLDALTSVLESNSLGQPQRCPPQSQHDQSTGQAVSDVARVRIGAVTGDAKFFLMSSDRRRELGLPHRACRPVLTRSRHLDSAFVDRQTFRSLQNDGERVYMFSPPDHLLEDAAVQRYMRRPVSVGGCLRTRRKVRERPYWYRPIMPPPVDAFVSGMSGGGLFLTINRMPTLRATNTLFVVQMREGQGKDAVLELAIALLSSQSQRQIERKRRWYAGGLQKIEPGELAAVSIPWPVRDPNPDLYSQAVVLLRSGKQREAIRMAERMV